MIFTEKRDILKVITDKDGQEVASYKYGELPKEPISLEAGVYTVTHIFYIVALTPFVKGTFLKAILVTGVALVTITHWIVKQTDVKMGFEPTIYLIII